jgi:site-specific DNA recombinase
MVRAAAIYARISSDREGTQAGVRRQVDDCHALAERRGWPVAEVYVDDDVSAYSGKVRPEYRRMLDDLAAGTIDAVVVWHLDRLHRQQRELEEFLDACDAVGVKNLATVSGDIDLATADGRLTARIMGAVASKESADKSRRIRRKHEELAAEGKPSGGGARPYGFEIDKVTVRADEAAVIRETAGRLLGGESLGSVCRDLNDRQLLTSTAKQWQPSRLRQMMQTARLSGQREHHSEIVGPAQWPAIITAHQTSQLRAKLNDPARKRTRAPRRYVLSGMVRCGKCDQKMVSRPRANGDRCYVCDSGAGRPGCGRVSIAAENLEALVIEAVLYRLDSPELAAALTNGIPDDTTSTDTQAALEADQAQLDELAGAYGEGEFTLSEWLAARAPIETRITTARKKLSRLSNTTVLDGYIGDATQLRTLWNDLTISRQQAIMKALLDHLTIASADPARRRFDPDRATPTWKH